MSKRRTYSRELKLEAIRLWQTTPKSAREVEEDLDITHGLLYKWKEKCEAAGDSEFADSMNGEGRTGRRKVDHSEKSVAAHVHGADKRAGRKRRECNQDFLWPEDVRGQPQDPEDQNTFWLDSWSRLKHDTNGGHMRVEQELRTYLQVLWRYKWMIAACAIIASMVALGISFQLTPLYSATATLRVASGSRTQLMNTYTEIAARDTSLSEVAKQLGLQKQPIVQVEIVPETELIRISASDPDPARARDIANTLANIMIEQRTQLYGGSAPTAREILEGQLQQAKIDLDAALSEYDSALRGAQYSATLPASGTPIPNPNAETLAILLGVRQEIYNGLLQKYEAAWTSENAITVFEPASVPQYPASPRIPLNAALGLLAGLATGVILAFLFEGMDDTLRGIEDVQAMTTLPILCTVPELKRKLRSSANLSISRDGNRSLTPAFDQLGARLILSDAKPKSATFLITSPEPGVGKSTVAANLAVSLAEAGNRVVLVDMDFHRPRLHSILGLPNGKGLSNFMRGEIQLDATLHATARPNLRVVTAGSRPHVPSDWLTPVKIGSLLETLGKESDYVLIDAPALLIFADPTVLASQVDAVILLVARRKTERQNLRFALQQLAELKAKVAGIVVNRVPNSRLYSYYSERHWKQLPSRRGKTTNQMAVDARSKHFGLDEKSVDAVP